MLWLVKLDLYLFYDSISEIDATVFVAWKTDYWSYFWLKGGTSFHSDVSLNLLKYQCIIFFFFFLSSRGVLVLFSFFTISTLPNIMWEDNFRNVCHERKKLKIFVTLANVKITLKSKISESNIILNLFVTKAFNENYT